MNSITCFEPAEADGWRQSAGPRYLCEQDGTLLIDLGRTARRQVHVNGLPVIGGLQVVQAGDLVRIARANRPDLTYIVGGVQAVRQPGRGRRCQFTGLPIKGEAVRCACGALYSSDVADQMADCPQCQASLRGQLPAPPEELL